MTADAAIAEVARQHHGVFGVDDARRCGLSEAQMRHRVDTGRWERLRRGVFVIAGLPSSPLQTLAAATVEAHVVASHRSAAALHGLLDHPDRPEVTTSVPRSHGPTGVRLHRCADLAAADLVTVEGIRTTSSIRTLIDLGARVDERRLARIVDAALHRRLAHIDPLVARFLQLARPGRDGIAAMRQVLRSIDPALGFAESDLETLTASILADAGLPPPVRQHRVVVGGRMFRLDLAYPAVGLAIECDGFAHHGSRLAFESDRERQNLLVNAGWRLLRFTWRQVLHRPDDVVSQVAMGLAGPSLPSLWPETAD